VEIRRPYTTTKFDSPTQQGDKEALHHSASNRGDPTTLRRDRDAQGITNNDGKIGMFLHLHQPIDIFHFFLSRKHISGVTKTCTSEQG
jgi:hypothetical protein